MNADLMPFTFEGRQVRTMTLDGEPRLWCSLFKLSFPSTQKKELPGWNWKQPLTTIMHEDNITSVHRRKIACPLTSEDDIFAAATHLEICLLRNSPELTTALTRLLETVRLRRCIVQGRKRPQSSKYEQVRTSKSFYVK